MIPRLYLIYLLSFSKVAIYYIKYCVRFYEVDEINDVLFWTGINERTTHRNIIKSLNSYYSNRLSILVETIGFNFKE